MAHILQVQVYDCLAHSSWSVARQHSMGEEHSRVALLTSCLGSNQAPQSPLEGKPPMTWQPPARSHLLKVLIEPQMGNILLTHGPWEDIPNPNHRFGTCMLIKQLYLHVYCNTILNSQDLASTEVSINGWLDNENVVCIHNGVLFNCKELQNYSLENLWNWRSSS